MSKKNPSKEEVRAAYREVLGREPDKGGLENYMNAGLTGDRLKKDLASSKEASRRKGLDVTKYGVKVRSLDGLNSRYQETFNQYKDKFGWDETKITNSVLEEVKGVTHLFKTDESRAQWDAGNVTIDSGSNGKLMVTVTPNAVRNLGSDLNLHFAGTEGTEYLFPTQVNINGETQNVTMKNKRFSGVEEFKIDGESTGYSATRRIPKPSTGVTGFLQKVGLPRDVAAVVSSGITGNIGPTADKLFGIKEGYVLSDPLNYTSGLTSGQEGYRRNVEGGANLTGSSESNFERGQGITQAVTTAAIGMWNPMIGAALASTSAANRAAADRSTWRDAAVTSVTSFGAAGLSQYLGVSNWSAPSQVAYQGTSAAASSAFSQQLGSQRRVDWDEVGRSAAIGAASSALTQYGPQFRYTVGTGETMRAGTVSPWATVLSTAVARTPEERAVALGSFGLSSAGAAMAAMSKTGSFQYDPNILDPVPGESGGWWQEFREAHRGQTLSDVSEVRAAMSPEYWAVGPQPRYADFRGYEDIVEGAYKVSHLDFQRDSRRYAGYPSQRGREALGREWLFYNANPSVRPELNPYSPEYFMESPQEVMGEQIDQFNRELTFIRSS
jgi:hypothetical protein